MRNQKMTSQTSMVWTYKLTSKVKDEKPKNDKPNINGMDLQINLKIVTRQINGRLQFMKTIEGTHINIQYSIMLLVFYL
jgi:hypothetical protein